MSSVFYTHLEKCARRGMFIGRKGLLFDTRPKWEQRLDAAIGRWSHRLGAKHFGKRHKQLNRHSKSV